MLHVQIGLADPLAAVNLDVADPDPFAVSPGLVLPGWILKQPGAYASSVSLMSDLGRPLMDGEVLRRQPAVSLDLLIWRRSLLYVAPDFLCYMLAIGLCCMSLLITHSRDDLILAAVVSAGGQFCLHRWEAAGHSHGGLHRQSAADYFPGDSVCGCG